MTRRAFLFVFSSAAVSAVMIFAVAGCAAAQPTPDVPATVRAVVEGSIADTPTPVDAEATALAVLMSIPPIPTATPRPPVLTTTPAPTITPHPSSTPISTATPVDVQATARALLAAVPTEPPVPVATPAPTATPQAVATPVDVLATVSALVDAFTPVPTETPIPAATPVHTATPQPTATVVSVEIPEIPNVESTVQAVLDELPTATPVPPVDDRSDFAATMAKVEPSIVRIHAPNTSGTGVIIDPRGYILTVKHGISLTRTNIVTLDDGTSHPARVVATGRSSATGDDIALLKIGAGRELTSLGVRSDVRVGEDVIIVGYPLIKSIPTWKNQPAMTKGVVSAIRNFEGYQWLQTDAAANPGNSGGPVIDVDGNIVGLALFVTRNLGIRNVDYFGQGLAFAHSARTINAFLANHLDGGGTSDAPEEDNAYRIAGPDGMTIPHMPNNGKVDLGNMGLSFKTGVIEGVFANPYPARDAKWSHGFMFRVTQERAFHAVGITSNGSMFHEYRDTNGVAHGTDLGSSKLIDTGHPASNTIKVVARNDDGELWVNGSIAATFDLGDLAIHGDVEVFANFFTGHGLANRSSKVSDIYVWEYSQLWGSE